MVVKPADGRVARRPAPPPPVVARPSIPAVRPSGWPSSGPAPLCADCGAGLGDQTTPIVGLCGLCYANRLVHGTHY
jgi:hypothetical protein